MKHASERIHLRDVKITQFESVAEAMQILPEALLLHYINSAWKNTQILKLSDAMKPRQGQDPPRVWSRRKDVR